MLKTLISFCLSRRTIVLFGLFAFAVAGLYAFKVINIESYPNPTPVILEITAEGPGLSAEEIERYYTIPMEIALYATPGSRSSARPPSTGCPSCAWSSSRASTMTLPSRRRARAAAKRHAARRQPVPSIQQNSGTGEIYRYTVVGPTRYGLTDLRTVQDWIVLRRLSTIPGIITINSWGGTTKEFEVQLDPPKLEAFNVTVPQVSDRPRQRQYQRGRA